MEDLLRVVARPAVAVDEVLGWLGKRVGGEVAVLGADAGVECGTAAFPDEVLGDDVTALARRVAAGRVASAVTVGGAWSVRLERIGGRPPYRVLVVAGHRALVKEEAVAASGVCALLDLLRRAGETDVARREYERKARQVGLGLFMALMAGDAMLARRMSGGAPPPLLDCERLRVHLLRCVPDDQDRLLRAYRDASGFHGRGLMVRCPVYDEHLICLIPEGEGLAGELRGLVGENRRYALGISAPLPPAATAEAYEQARHALAVARNAPDRVAGYQGREPLDRLLPPDVAMGWADAFLRPIDSAPAMTVEITRLAMRFPRAGVARLLGISRNTVAAHLRRVESALGVDLGDIRTRAVVALALAILGRHRDTVPARPLPAATLDDLFESPSVASWAASALQPLDDPARPQLRSTVRAWLEAGADARHAARRLGNSRTTVTARLRAAERLLDRDLLAAESGVHELLYAFHHCGEIRLDGAP
ncbi:helix-turn-helix domain-containing protein [Streptomyces sp. SCSIO 75703]|uniref:helix-turn-helix domain-containing protein n=1 Tax=Streptomyces sp. SCSIO 75703 TaxID=3112165 RepID=UPI0030CE34CC